MKKTTGDVRNSESDIANDELLRIGKRLEQARLRLGHLQAGMADLLGVHKNTYGRWERGEREMGAAALAGLHSIGWNLNWVLTGEGPERLEALQDSGFSGNAASQAAASQPVRLADITLAVQLAEEALEGKRLGPEDYGQLVGLIHDALVNGLPSAQVLAFARPAARGIRGTSSVEFRTSGQAASGQGK